MGSVAGHPSERFSLVAGGPFYVLCTRLGICTPDLGRVALRAGLFAALAWLPLLVLSMAAGSLREGAPVPFLHDLEVHIRLLVALPLLLAAELPVHGRLAFAVRKFVQGELVRDGERSRFEAIVASTLRWRNAWLAEVLILAFVYLMGRTLWRDLMTLDTATWYAMPAGTALVLSPAGRWLAWVSVPIVQFVIYRWLYRLLLWISLLVRVSRLDLDLVPTHPDRAAGLFFLGTSSLCFATFLAALGAQLCALIAGFILFEGAKLTDYQVGIAGCTVLLLTLVLGPLLAFSPKLARVKRDGLGEYGTLANRYVRDFDERWLRSATHQSQLLGSPDIQSLADLANSYDIVRSMHPVPFGRKTLIALTAAFLAPLSPLVLTMIPVEQVLARLLEMLL